MDDLQDGVQETTALIVKEIDLVFHDWQQIKDKIAADQKIQRDKLNTFRAAYLSLKMAILPNEHAHK